jgi:hypothetical protein
MKLRQILNEVKIISQSEKDSIINNIILNGEKLYNVEGLKSMISSNFIYMLYIDFNLQYEDLNKESLSKLDMSVLIKLNDELKKWIQDLNLNEELKKYPFKTISAKEQDPETGTKEWDVVYTDSNKKTHRIFYEQTYSTLKGLADVFEEAAQRPYYAKDKEMKNFAKTLRKLEYAFSAYIEKRNQRK